MIAIDAALLRSRPLPDHASEAVKAARGAILAIGGSLGLLARGADPLTATIWGVFLHGEAGRRLAARQGRIGFLARELLAEIPPAMHAISAA